MVTESVPLSVGNGHGPNGHGNGHGTNGHGTQEVGDAEHAAVTSGESGQTVAGQGSPEDPPGH